MIRQQQFMEEIGPAFGRLSVELLPKIINRVIFILQRKGFLPETLRIDNKNITIRYQSPLVRSAAIQKIQNLQNYVSILQPILGPQLTVASLNIEAMPQWLSDKLDVDETLVKSVPQMKAIMEKIQQAALPPPPPGQGEAPPNAQLADQTRPQQAGIEPNG
jgi:hypothetical protein